MGVGLGSVGRSTSITNTRYLSNPEIFRANKMMIVTLLLLPMDHVYWLSGSELVTRQMLSSGIFWPCNNMLLLSMSIMSIIRIISIIGTASIVISSITAVILLTNNSKYYYYSLGYDYQRFSQLRFSSSDGPQAHWGSQARRCLRTKA